MRTRFPSFMARVIRSEEPDAVLVRRFADVRDEAAFAELVRRYGRLVWGQCRNLLPAEADADDAFQATFVVLAESAGKLRDANKLGPWLHGVAYRVCKNARRVAARRAKRERGSACPEASRPVAEATWDAALAAVHDELHRLPDTLRVPFVLCCLEGKGTTEAADQLGLKLGTFSARLTRAKQALMDRLSARGITAGVAALASVVGQAAAPARATARAVAHSTGTVPANILSLTHGVVGMTMYSGKLLAAAVLVSVGLAAGFGGSWQANAQDAKPKSETQNDQQKMIQELRKQIEQLERQAEQSAAAEAAARDHARSAAEQARAQAVLAEQKMKEAVRAREQETARRAEEARTKGAEFRYLGQSADFAPTPQQFEELVKRGEAGGYKFVGVVTMKGTTKKDGEAAPTLVFRRAGTNVAQVVTGDLFNKIADANIEHGTQVHKSAVDALTKAAQAAEKLNLARPEMPAKVEAELREKLADRAKELRDLTQKLDVEAARAKLTDLAAVREKVEAARNVEIQNLRKAELDKVKPDETAKRKKSEDQSKEAEGLQGRIDALNAELAKLQAANRPKDAAQDTLRIPVATLGKGDAESHAKWLVELVTRKFGSAKLRIKVDPDDNAIVVSGEPEVLKWLKEAVALLKAK